MTTIDKIDVQLHLDAIPATGYVGPGTIVGHPSYNANTNMLTGYFTSAGNDVAIPAGFQAQEVEITNVDDVTKFVWRRGLAATKTLKMVTAGDLTLDTSSAITVVDGECNKVSTITLSAAAVGTGKNVLYKVLG